VPDETTILNFRRLLERHVLSREIFEAVKEHLQAAGVLLRQGAIVDAAIIAAPSWTTNKKGERDPEMHQTKGANQPPTSACNERHSSPTIAPRWEARAMEMEILGRDAMARGHERGRLRNARDEIGGRRWS
jgi:IS5 family transposase